MRLLAASIFLTLLGIPLFAGIGPEIRLSGPISYPNDVRAVFDGDQFIVLWSDADGVHLQRVSSSGALVGSSRTVSRIGYAPIDLASNGSATVALWTTADRGPQLTWLVEDEPQWRTFDAPPGEKVGATGDDFLLAAVERESVAVGLLPPYSPRLVTTRTLSQPGEGWTSALLGIVWTGEKALIAWQRAEPHCNDGLDCLTYTSWGQFVSPDLEPVSEPFLLANWPSVGSLAAMGGEVYGAWTEVGFSRIVRLGGPEPLEKRLVSVSDVALANDAGELVAAWQFRDAASPAEIYFGSKSRQLAEDAGWTVASSAILRTLASSGTGTVMVLYLTDFDPSMGTSVLASRLVDRSSLPRLPYPPGGITVMDARPAGVRPGGMSLTVAWNRAPSAELYRMHAQAIDDPSEQCGSVTVTSGMGILADCGNDTPYAIRVQSENEIGISDAGELIYRTPAYGAPRPPLDASLEAGGASATIRWRDVSTIEKGFRLWLMQPTGNHELVAQLPADSTEVSVALRHGTNSYRVSAWNDAGETFSPVMSAAGPPRRRAASPR